MKRKKVNMENMNDSYEKVLSDDFVSNLYLIIFTDCAMLSVAFAFLALSAIDFIFLSMGHSSRTELRHYLGIPFTERDKQEMKEWVE
jgi:hypothetical protein